MEDFIPRRRINLNDYADIINNALIAMEESYPEVDPESTSAIINLTSVVKPPMKFDDFIQPCDIGKLQYRISCGIRENIIYTIWSMLCDSIKMLMKAPNVYRYTIDNDTLENEFEIKDTRVSPITMFSDSRSIIFTAPNIQELVEYILECQQHHEYSSTRYTYWHVVLDRNFIVDFKNAKSVHATIVIFDHRDLKIYYLDCNVNSILDQNGIKYAKYIDKCLIKYFQQLSEYGFNYQYVSNWRPNITLQISRSKICKEFDNGNCLTISILFTHWLATYQDFTPDTLYEHLAAMDVDARAQIIYNYIGNLVSWMVYHSHLTKRNLFEIASRLNNK
jgi:hypothetical protein